jgi:hypothetical protein
MRGSVRRPVLAIDFNDLPEDVLREYTDVRSLPDGRLIGVHRLVYHWTIHVDIDWSGYAERYCYDTYLVAKKAYDEWNGVGGPEGWTRHPTSGRRRNPATGEEWVAW